MKLHYPRTLKSHRGRKVAPQKVGPPLVDILIDICEVFGQPFERMSIPGRREEIIRCKRIYCYISCLITDASLLSIGKLINNDHTTVLHHRAIVMGWQKTRDSKFEDDWDDYVNNSKIWAQYKGK